jgi:hypothetical protein
MRAREQVSCSEGRAAREPASIVLSSASGGFRRTAKTPIMRFLLTGWGEKWTLRGVNALGRGRGSFSAPLQIWLLPKNHQD